MLVTQPQWSQYNKTLLCTLSTGTKAENIVPCLQSVSSSLLSRIISNKYSPMQKGSSRNDDDLYSVTTTYFHLNDVIQVIAVRTTSYKLSCTLTYGTAHI